MRRKGPGIPPEIKCKQSHEVLNHPKSKVVKYFRKQYTDAMRHKEQIGSTNQIMSCLLCTQGRESRAPFKKDQQNRFKLLEALT